MSTIQRCVPRWIQEVLRAHGRVCGAHRYAFSKARNIRSWLPPGADGSVSIQTKRNRLHEVQLRARVPATGVSLTTQLRGGMMLDHRMPFLHIDGRLTEDHYVTQTVESVVLYLLQDAPNTVFQKDNTKSHVAREALNCLPGSDILPRLTNSPDLNPIEHLWDLI
ncbi:transposable element Tcb1 transposase [Trichonephila clavipes]|nr:transposable element Tcb1 transposase [Trichonephila clavipes]